MRKHILPLLLCLIMVISLMPTTALADAADISYIDKDGAAHYVSASNVAKVTSSNAAVTWDKGWYLVNENVTITNATLGADTKLILADGKTLTVNGGTSHGISCGGYDLTIYAQSEGTGKLAITTTNNDSYGIYTSNGKITIVGGDIDITTNGDSSRGIYSKSLLGSTTIFGGDIDITSKGDSSSGISSDSGSITISGGDVNIKTEQGESSGISSGTGRITISGGDVNIKTEQGESSGISSGIGDITISGGTVESFAQNDKAFDGTVILGGDYANSVNRIVLVGSSCTDNTEWNGTSTLNTAANYVKIMPSTVSYSYIDENNTQQTHTAIVLSNGAAAEWDKGWYVVNDSVTIGGMVTLTTDTKLILADGKTLTVNGGSDRGIDCGMFDLTIYAQSTATNMGKLVITTTYSDRYGIGGGGNIKIVGGDIDITTNGDRSHGISSSYGNIEISGGDIDITTKGGSLSGIYSMGSGSITISGGDIDITTEDSQSYGISNYTGAVEISGGDIDITTEGYGSYGINNRNGGITISGGDIDITTKGSQSCGISNYTGAVEISGGDVNITTEKSDSHGISSDSGRGNITISGGDVNVKASDTNAYGIYNNEGFSTSGDTKISGGTVTSIGGKGAFYIIPTGAAILHGAYLTPTNRAVKVSSTTDAADATTWNEETPLTTYKYVSIAPLAPTPTPSAMPTHGGTPIYYWSNQNPQPESTPTLPDVNTLISPTQTPATTTPDADTDLPPQTGDSSTVLGFIMAALLVAAFVTVKRINAR